MPVPPSRAVTVFKAAFILLSVLVLAAVAYTGWIVARYWSATGV